jgi:hypothetical protein
VGDNLMRIINDAAILGSFCILLLVSFSQNVIAEEPEIDVRVFSIN